MKHAYSVEDARQELGGISRGKLYSEINAGRLRTFRLGRRRVISAQAIADYIAMCEDELAEQSQTPSAA